jgi:protein-tyrosine phosphatase
MRASGPELERPGASHPAVYTVRRMLAESSTVLFLCSGNYYRSRFAELLFNHLVKDTALAYRADSAGLWPNCRTHNFGPISAATVAALRTRGVSLPESHRIPRDVTEAEIRNAAVTVALKEAEHRPIVVDRFPSVLERIEFWHVHDVEDAPPSEAIPLIETNVIALIARLARGPLVAR